MYIAGCFIFGDEAGEINGTYVWLGFIVAVFYFTRMAVLQQVIEFFRCARSLSDNFTQRLRCLVTFSHTVERA